MTIEKDLEKFLSEPKELKRCRDRLDQDMFAMIFVMAANKWKRFDLESLKTFSLQLQYLLEETETLKKLIIEHYSTDTNNEKETNE